MDCNDPVRRARHRGDRRCPYIEGVVRGTLLVYPTLEGTFDIGPGASWTARPVGRPRARLCSRLRIDAFLARIPSWSESRLSPWQGDYGMA